MRVLIEQTGAPNVMSLRHFELGPLAEGEALVRHTVIGVNFIDTYHRSGLYPLPTLPHGIGVEAAGVVEEVRGASPVQPGQRVVYAGGTPGAYASHRVVPSDRLIPLDDAVPDEVAAAVALKGMTAEYLIRRTYPVREDEFVLFHGAAGGVGLIACQWLAHIGARVIGTVGTADKARLAREHGCEFPLLRSEDFVSAIRDITDGAGVSVVYDGVGKTTFEPSLRCLKRRGLYVGLGNASGKPEPLDITRLSSLGSLYLTRPTLADYTADRSELLESARAVFEHVERGVVQPFIGQRFALEDVVSVHRALEGRKTAGATLMLP